MADLVGSIHQFLNNCKDTIVSWCKDAAKTVCLPLSGGSMNSGANITTTGTVTSGKIVIDKSYIDNGVAILKDSNPRIKMINTNIASGVIPESDVGSTVAFQTGDDVSISHIQFAANKISNNTDVRTMVYMCTHDFFNPDSYTSIAMYHDATSGFYTYSPHPMKFDASTNKFVLNPADNSNKIATTGWVNQALANMTKGYNTSNGTRYIKFPNGLMICAGYAANVTAGSVVNFPAAFKNMPDVVIVRHWGGTGDSTVGASSTVGSAPVQVYNTTVSSFRVGVHTATATDSTAYINGSYTIYAMWIAVGEWK